MEKKIIVAVAGAMVLLVAAAGLAAAQSPAATLRGVVVDPQGSRVFAATITVENRETDLRRTTRSDGEGRFAVAGLPPGPYDVTTRADGFAARRQEDLHLEAGQDVSLRFELTRAAAADTVTLAPRPPVLESLRAHDAATLQRAELTHLPIRGRRPLDLVPLLPGAVRVPATRELYITGQPGLENRFLVDGLDSRALTPALESISHITVHTGAPPAEYGGTLGGIVSVVTRSGTNTVDGSAFAFFGDDALVSQTSDDEEAGRATPPYSYRQFGGTVGGPLVVDHHFAFVSIDREEETIGVAPGDRDEGTTLLARTDHLIGAGRVGVRVDRHEAGPATAVTYDGQATVALPIGARWFNETRAAYARDRQTTPLLDRRQIADTLTFIAGDHHVKAGGEIAAFDPQDAQLAATTPPTDAYAAFVQDQWRASATTTIDVGLRYDGARDGDGNGPVVHQWGPRVGAVWSRPDNRVLLRGSYGLVAQPLSPASDPRPRLATAHQWSVGTEWAWMPQITLGAQMEHVQRREESALHYDGLTFQLLRRFSQGVHYRAAYTISRASVFDEPAPGETRHQLASSLIYDTRPIADKIADGWLESLLTDWILSSVVTVQSGQSEVFSSIDPRVARAFNLGDGRRLSVIWEVYDLDNRANYIGREPNRQPLTSRVMQLAARVEF